ncbi:MAG: tetratricopeptide repeat protein, partial [Chloroflexota bacterium]
AIDWSFHLLNAEEQQSFARLAVFESQFFAQAAQTITATQNLASLKNKSLIQQTGDQIFSMLTVLREYAFEQLTALGETEIVQQKHAAYYCQWLEEAQPHVNGRDQIAWFGRMKVELYNLQAALEWFLQHQVFEDAGRMVAILWRYWATQSLISEGTQWIERVFAHNEQLSPQIRARVAQGAGRFALLRFDYERSKAYQKTSLTLYQSVHDQEGEAAILQSLGETEFLQGNFPQAEIYLEAGLRLNRAINNEAGIGRCLTLIGKLIQQIGDFARAEVLLHESLSLSLAHGSSEAIALSLYELASVLRAQAKYQDAETCYRQSLALYEELNLGVGVATMLYNLGFTLQGRGDYTTAFKYLLDALKILQPLDELNAIAECLIGLSAAFLYQEKREMATKTLSAAQAILTHLEGDGQLSYIDQAEYERIYDALKMGETPWEMAWASGQATPLEQIIKDVFKEA